MVGMIRNVSMLIWFVVLNLNPVQSGSEADIIKALEETQQEVAWKYIPLSGPSIDESSSKNLTVQLGKTAVLNCRIKYLGGKTVSWMRARDLHLLTVGRFTYTSDERFKAIHQSGSDDWLLKIHYAQHRDSGAYECQVSTTPPVSTSIWLTVVAEPETHVLGGPDLYINSGSTINLTCVVHHSSDPPAYILWYHQKELLSYDSPRGGITVVTEHGPSSSSRLLIQRATKADAGQYSCRPSNAEPHQINVHIIPNEHPAAIHHKNGTSSCRSLHNIEFGARNPSFILTIILSLLFLFPNILLLFEGGIKIPKQGFPYHRSHQPLRMKRSSQPIKRSQHLDTDGIGDYHIIPAQSNHHLSLQRIVEREPQSFQKASYVGDEISMNVGDEISMMFRYSIERIHQKETPDSSPLNNDGIHISSISDLNRISNHFSFIMIINRLPVRLLVLFKIHRDCLYMLRLHDDKLHGIIHVPYCSIPNQWIRQLPICDMKYILIS